MLNNETVEIDKRKIVHKFWWNSFLRRRFANAICRWVNDCWRSNQKRTWHVSLSCWLIERRFFLNNLFSLDEKMKLSSEVFLFPFWIEWENNERILVFTNEQLSMSVWNCACVSFDQCALQCASPNETSSELISFNMTIKCNSFSEHWITLGRIAKTTHRRFERERERMRNNLDYLHDNWFHNNQRIDFDQWLMADQWERYLLEHIDLDDYDANIRMIDIFPNRFSNNVWNNHSRISNDDEAHCSHVKMYSRVFHRSNLCKRTNE